jgi:hypothetical protein
MCDGCRKSIDSDHLTSLGDGSLKVCRDCRPIAECLIQGAPQATLARLYTALRQLIRVHSRSFAANQS